MSWFEKKPQKIEKALSANGEQAYRELEGSLANAKNWSIDINKKHFDKKLTEFKSALRELIANMGETVPQQMRDRAEIIPLKFVEKHGQDVEMLQFAGPLFHYAYNSPVATNALAGIQYGNEPK